MVSVLGSCMAFARLILDRYGVGFRASFYSVLNKITVYIETK
jgi:hypothetical protein